MNTMLLVGVAVLVAANLILVIWLLLKSGRAGGVQLEGQFDNLAKAQERTERMVREEIARNREEAATAARQGREETANTLKGFLDSLLARMGEIATFQKNQLDTFAASLTTLTASNEQKLESLRQVTEQKLAQFQADMNKSATMAREESAHSLKVFSEVLLSRMTEIATLQKNQLDTFATSLATLTTTNEQKLEAMRQTVEGKLAALQQDNAAKLEQIRLTVDEKLHATLEQRLGESFKIVSERLELVHKGLGEMQNLASGVGDLKKVLTNIKTRGTWGEVQLGNLLEQMLTPDQYATNVQVNPATMDRVEFAVKFPGATGATGRDGIGKPYWLPIDAKFPQEDYQRLSDAADRGDAEAVAACAEALEARIYAEAKKIRDKYISPPDTTDFAILFLPTEGLFADVLRRPGLCDGILHEYRVVLTGPTTLAAVLSSFQMGFRTLAIEKRSSEVWQVLGAVKTEFGKFGDVLEKVQKKLQEASNTVDTAATRSRVLERKLKGVEAVPEETTAKLLGSIEGLGMVDGQHDESSELLSNG